MIASNVDILMKCILLLHRENELGENSTNNSKDVVKKILTTTKESKNKVLLGGETSILDDIRTLLSNMMSNPDSFDRTTLLESLNIILKDKQSLLKAIEKNINTELTPSSLKRSIIATRSILNNYHKDQEIYNIINSACYRLNTGKLDNNMTIQAFAEDIRSKLELLSFKTDEKDPGIIDEVDIYDTESVNKAVNNVKKLSEVGGKFITGWKKVNKMTNGGFRRGEQWVITALQHNYKSGFVQSLFAQFATLNKPDLDDPTKKPLNILFSFEDDINIIMEFMYRYLYFNEYRELPELSALTTEQISKYVTDKLSVNGYHVKILRINPANWTYMHLFNKILEYEADGYEIHAVLIDYLSKLPTTGCITSGPSGTDVRDLFNRVRNFCSAKKILNITPHQISTEAIALARSGLKGFDFINELVNKNYYSESKQIPQVVDGEIVLAKGYINKKWSLYIGKGKHRTPIITPDEDKQCSLAFPKAAPIPEDINDPDGSENPGTEEFEF